MVMETKTKLKMMSETDCLAELKVSIQKDQQNELPPDDFLLRFVRGKNQDSKAAFDTYTNYVKIRREKYRNLFSNYSNPSSFKHVFDSGMVKVLKHRDGLGRNVLIMRSEQWNVSEIGVDDVIISILELCEELLNSIETQKKGIVIIRDYQGFGLSHMKICTLQEVKKACTVFINSFPCKYKACHVIRNSYFFHLLLSMAKPFMPYKLKSRFFIHGMNLSSLHDSISPDILPEFLGGKLTECEAFDDDIFLRILKNERHFI